MFAQRLLGDGLDQALMLARLLPWIGARAFAPSYRAFSFGVAALPTLAMRMVECGAGGLVAAIAPPLFIGANLVCAVRVVQTLRLWVGGLPGVPAQAIGAAPGR